MTNDLAGTLDTAEVAARLRIAMARLNRVLRRQNEPGHSPAALSALASVSRLGPLTLGELAEAEAVSPPTITVLAGRLEEQGLIARELDPGDRRLVRVSLTAEGRLALSRSRSRRNAYLAQRLKGLSAEELDKLAGAAALLERILEQGR